MSTRGNICAKVRKEDFSKVNEILAVRNREVSEDLPYVYIYNHFDSYPEYLGQLLLKKYNDYSSALKLVLAGDCSTPGEPYTLRGESFESNCPRVTGCKLRALQEEYLYVFEDNNWEGYDFNESKLDLNALEDN